MADRTRFNGHNAYIYDEHCDKFDRKLGNFGFGIVKCMKPTSLDRMKGYYINLTKADIISLNRYKAVE